MKPAGPRASGWAPLAAGCTLLATACTPSLPCGGARVALGGGGEAALLPAPRPEAWGERGDGRVAFLLDTGFRRSALGPAGQAAAQAAPDRDFTLAGVRLEADFQPWVLAQAPGVLGAEVLGALPLTLDPLAGTLAVQPAFPSQEPGDVALRRHAVSACDDPGVAFTLEAPVAGRTVAWLLDTGAEHTVLRSALLEELAAGLPRLSGVVLETAFAGVIRAEAVRLSRVGVGEAAAQQVVVLSGAALDAELDRQSAWLTRAAGAPVTVDGLLGWNALREGRLSFRGPAAGPASALRFTPYPASPWPRAFVGVGLGLAPAAGGLRVVSVYVPSPAAEAGVTAGDLLVSVDGRPAAEAPAPFAPAGQSVTLVLQRGAERLERRMAVVDLLPDAPAQ
jgi:hypothetical protein